MMHAATGGYVRLRCNIASIILARVSPEFGGPGKYCSMEPDALRTIIRIAEDLREALVRY